MAWPAGGVRRSLAAAALAVLLLPSDAGAEACAPQEGEGATVAAVVDERSLMLADGQRIVLAGVGSFAPLSPVAARGRGDVQPLPSEAIVSPVPGPDPGDEQLQAALTRLLKDAVVSLLFAGSRPDRYGRRPAYVFVNGTLVQAAVAEQGVAFFMPPAENQICGAAILAAEAVARRHHRGGWRTTRVDPASPSLAVRTGRFAIAEGTVVSVGARRDRTYVDFGRRWREDVTIEIAAGDRDAFGGDEALQQLVGRTVRIRGFVEAKGGPMIRARWPGQIEVVSTQAGGGREAEP